MFRRPHERPLFGHGAPTLTLIPTLTLALGACGGSGGSGAGSPPPVVAEFGADRLAGEAPLQVQFTDLSVGPVTSWQWDFGDGGSSTERNPLHAFTHVGTFGVRLTVAGGSASDTLERVGWIDVAARPSSGIEYGMNPSFSRWSSREIVFADAMMRASEFLIVRAGELTQEPAPLFPLGRTPPRVGAGWPDPTGLASGESAGARLFGAMDGTLPDGRVVPWILTWEGTGRCSLNGTAVLGELRRTARRVEVRIDPVLGAGNGNVSLWIEDSSRVDPVRNVHVWLPGTDRDQPLFWPPYVERVQAMNHGAGPFHWRTLDWCRVNDYGAMDPPLPFTFDLAGVIRPTSPSQGTRRGVCPEFQVAFCNTVGANLHYQLPHRTDALDETEYELFLRDTLTRIRDGAPAVPGINGGRPFEGLNERLGLTLELSNELWNAGFPASRWMSLEAQRRGLTQHEVIAAELTRMWRIADEVFAGRRIVRRFIGGFIAQAGFVERILAALPSATRVDALGPSCYFRPRSESVDAWLAGSNGSDCPNCPSPEAVIEAALRSLDELGPFLAAHWRVAEAHANPDGSHPRLEVYEAGQSFDAQGGPWGPAARAAQSLPQMFSAYVEGLIPMLVREHVDAVNWYSFMTDQDPSHGIDVGFGVWSDMGQSLTLPVREPYLDEGAPKAAAIYLGPPR